MKIKNYEFYYNGKCYFFYNTERSNYRKEYYFCKNNILNLKDYYIIKGSFKFKFIEENEIEKWSAFCLFEKTKWHREDIQKILNIYNNVGLVYLIKIAPIDVLNKVEYIDLNKC